MYEKKCKKQNGLKLLFIYLFTDDGTDEMDELSGADPQSCSNNELELTNSLEEDKENLSHEGKFYIPITIQITLYIKKQDSLKMY